jgi:hypothetical protein
MLKYKTVLNMKLKGNHPRGRPRSRWEQQVRRDVIDEERRISGEVEEEGELWEDKRQMKRLGC